MKRNKKSHTRKKSDREPSEYARFNVLVEQFQDQLCTVAENVTGIHHKLKEHDKRFDSIDAILLNHTVRLDRIETVQEEHSKKLDDHSQHFVSIESKLDHKVGKTEFEARVGALERSVN